MPNPNVNNMDYVQAATLLQSIVEQCTGESAITSIAPGDFISIGQTALKAGYDKVLGAITQLIGRTIFSVRPYSGKFADVVKTQMEWGSVIRKLKIADTDWQDSAEFDLTEGQSIDQWKVHKANVLSVNFYGQNTFELQPPSILMDQLDAAFRGPEELNAFFAMIATNTENQKVQKTEAIARMLVANFMAAKISTSSPDVIHLLTEYNTETGQSLTATTVYAPANFPDFVYWLYARLETLAGMMSERTDLFQVNVTGKVINQHTPADRLVVKMYAPLMNAINARVRARTFDNSYLQMASTEAVNFWQSASTPTTIKCTPSYLKADGTIETAQSAVTAAPIGVMYDRDLLGTVTQNERAMMTNFNAKGHYANQFFSYVQKWYTDFTEKGVVLMLD
jgi:hypothetical protein